MGHKKKNSDTHTLHQQAYDRLQSMLHIGDSKLADKRADREHDTARVAGKIYSYETYRTYWKHTKYFLQYVKENHPGCKDLKDARPYVSEWLQTRVDEGKSSWTVQTEEAALNKVFGIQKDDPDRFIAPARHRVDIDRSRGEKVRDRNFNPAHHEDLINFCKGTGARRGVLERMVGSDLLTHDQVAQMLDRSIGHNAAMEKACRDALTCFPGQDYYVLHRRDKGGKTRISPIVGPHKDEIVARFQATKPDERVWLAVSSNCDVHGYRADYAAMLYRDHARPIDSLRFQNKVMCADGKMRSEVYCCQKDNRGVKYDREALHVVSVALGHNREDTAVSSYLRNL